MSHTDRIQQLLLAKPGLKAQEIATELGLDRPQVAAALHAASGVTQDSAYRWWPRAPAAEPAPAPRTLLARLCRYYLECLARESGPSVSLHANADGVDFVELDQLPFA